MSPFNFQLLLGTAIIAITVVFHVAVLYWFARKMSPRSEKENVKPGRRNTFTPLILSTFVITILHSIEAWLWAFLYFFRNEFAAIEDALYFSVVTITTLGYGDLTVSKNSQILASFEAMGGLVLFGVSVAFLLGVMREIFDDINSSS